MQEARQEMVAHQLVARGIGDAQVLRAMSEVPRELSSRRRGVVAELRV